MARRKRHVTIDGNSHIIEPEASIADALRMAGFESMPPSITSGGELITVTDYSRPVPSHDMTTNQTDMVKGGGTLRERLLDSEFDLITRFLSEFPGRKRSVEMDDNHLLIRNFPLPDSYTLDHVDLLFLISAYYAAPPAGIHIPHNSPNREQIAKHLGGHLMSTTPSFVLDHTPERNREQVKKLADLGWDWVCFHFKGWEWRLNPQNLLAGDCLYKLIENVFVALAGRHK